MAALVPRIPPEANFSAQVVGHSRLRKGQLCLLKSETTPPCRWPLARIVRLHLGEDGQVRVVDVRTASGELTRPVVKIVPLPTADVASPEPPS